MTITQMHMYNLGPMRYEHLRSMDLNLLIALCALMEEGSVTGAARRMFVSQPAMSRMFHRLQTMLNDELLIRTPKGYQPTCRATALYGELQTTLPKLQALLSKSEFDPSNAKGVFRIGSSDWGAAVLVPALVRIVADRAWGIQLDVVPKESTYEALESNAVDLVLGGPILKSANQNELLRSEPLLRDKIVCLMRKGHRLAEGPLSLQQYAKAEHISLSSTPTGRRTPLSFSAQRQPSVADALEQLGQTPDVRVRVPYFVSLGLIVATTDLVATLPMHIARRVKTAKTCIVSAPREFRGVSYHQIWHSRNDSNPLHEWLRGIIRAIASKAAKRQD